MLKKQLVSKIKEKKELSGLSDSIVSEKLETYLKKNKISLEEKSEKEIKLIVKELRSDLRLLVGRFQTSIKSKKELLDKGEIERLLKTHSSTSERIDFYPKFKRLISDLNAKSILDIGCGLNPIALSTPEIKYYATDINEGDLGVIEDFFKSKKIKGETFVLDITKINKQLPKTDICLILKVLDIVDPKHNQTESILKKIRSKKIIVSFSTKKLSGRKMNHPRRFWFEKLLEKLRYDFSTLEIENEYFYIIKKD